MAKTLPRAPHPRLIDEDRALHTLDQHEEQEFRLEPRDELQAVTKRRASTGLVAQLSGFCPSRHLSALRPFRSAE